MFITGEFALHAYKPLVEQYEQAHPMLLLITDDGPRMVDLSTMGRDLHESLVAFTEVIPALAPINEAVLTSESWLREPKPPNDIVGEQVLALGVSVDGDGYYACWDFVREDGKVVWGDPEVHPLDEDGSSVAGPALDLLRILVSR